MRCWHKDLIPVLPRQQLLGQWRECCLIAKNIAEKGYPGHILVNRIYQYPLEHFYSYSAFVMAEMVKRQYKCNWSNFEKYFYTKDFHVINFENLFQNWHNKRYLYQCFYNLQEKYDCGGIAEEEWGKIMCFMEKEFIKEYWENRNV